MCQFGGYEELGIPRCQMSQVGGPCKAFPSLYSCLAHWALNMVLEESSLVPDTVLSAHKHRHMHEEPNYSVTL